MVNIHSEIDFKYDIYEPNIQLIFGEIKKEIKDDEVDCSIIFVDNDKIKFLNKTYRNIDKETDVLSFEMKDEINVENKDIGEIYISVKKAIEQAEEYGHTLEREILFLVTHGLLHLIGYDHMNEAEERIMINRQKKIMEMVGV